MTEPSPEARRAMKEAAAAVERTKAAAPGYRLLARKVDETWKANGFADLIERALTEIAAQTLRRQPE
jgi:dihydroneopterin aldolase